VAWCMLVIMVPPVMADTIPRDCQLGVRELLDSLPLSSGIYVAGKLVGAWASLLLGWAGFGVGVGLAWLPILGSFYLGPYLDTWLIGVLPLTLYTVAVSVLLPAGQPTRRRAVLVSGFFMAIAVLTVTDLYAPLVRTWRTPLCPGAWLYVLADKQVALQNISLMSAFPWLMPRLLASAGLQVGLLWAAVWAWKRWKVER